MYEQTKREELNEDKELHATQEITEVQDELGSLSETQKQQRRRDFDRYYRTYRMVVHDLCRRRFSNEEDAGDLESVVWTEVYRFFDRFQTEDPRKILYQLIKWRANDLYRRLSRKKQENTELDLEDGHLMRLIQEGRPQEPSPEEKLALAQVLTNEPAEDRQILFGRFVEGLSWEELAARHTLHRNTLLRRVKSSLARLHEQLKDVRPMEQNS